MVAGGTLGRISQRVQVFGIPLKPTGDEAKLCAWLPRQHHRSQASEHIPFLACGECLRSEVDSILGSRKNPGEDLCLMTVPGRVTLAAFSVSLSAYVYSECSHISFRIAVIDADDV